MVKVAMRRSRGNMAAGGGGERWENEVVNGFGSAE
jgi:hypothetical protein